jgi:CHAT domain-containing protein
MAARGGSEDFAPLPGTRFEVEALARLFQAEGRHTRTLLGADASEPELDRLATSGELGRFGFIHLATHCVIDEGVPVRSAVILTQTGLTDPLQQALNHQPVFDARLTVRETQRGWELKAELVTLSACDTALGCDAGGDGFVGFAQALLMSGTRSVCLSLWEVDDTATALLMQRFYTNLLGRRPGQSSTLPKAEALREAKAWLRGLTSDEVGEELKQISRGRPRSKKGKPVPGHPFEHPHDWAGFILMGDPSSMRSARGGHRAAAPDGEPRGDWRREGPHHSPWTHPGELSPPRGGLSGPLRHSRLLGRLGLTPGVTVSQPDPLEEVGHLEPYL